MFGERVECVSYLNKIDVRSVGYDESIAIECLKHRIPILSFIRFYFSFSEMDILWTINGFIPAPKHQGNFSHRTIGKPQYE